MCGNFFVLMGYVFPVESFCNVESAVYPAINAACQVVNVSPKSATMMSATIREKMAVTRYGFAYSQNLDGGFFMASGLGSMGRINGRITLTATPAATER